LDCSLGAAFPDVIDSIGLAPSDPNTIYVSANGSTYVTTNHGLTWSLHNLPADGYLADIQVDPANAQTAYAVIGQFTTGGNVFKTTNGGATWTNVTGNLPNLPVFSFQLDSTTANLYYVGAEDGVYRTIDGGVTWNRLGLGMPNAQVFQLELNSTLNVLGAATHGRGAWEILSIIPSTLTYNGDTSADYHDDAHFSATLTVTSSGAPIPGMTIHFTIGTQSCDPVTNASGIASCTINVTQAPGNYTVIASFAGSGAYEPSSDSKAFIITREETTLTYTGDIVIANGGTAHLSAVLKEDGTTPIAGRTINFTLGTGVTAQTCNGGTDATGKAACNIGPVNQPLGPGTVSAKFAGDAFYLPSSDSANTILFAFLTSGGFMVGDGSAALGTRDEFWGADWSQVNALSDGPAPNSFKGFAENLSSEPPKCGITWTTGAGNSSDPPATLPTYIGVLVTPSVSKSGPNVSGRVTQIVVVSTDVGYARDPGHSGTGTVVAQFCH
jgi:hypothetical protein